MINSTPTGYKFFIKLFNDGNEIDLHLQVEIKVIKRVFRTQVEYALSNYPDNVADLSTLSICVMTEKDNGEIQSFMKEPEL